MEDKVLIEIVAAHADQLRDGRAKISDYLAMFPDYREKLKPLLEIAEKVKQVLEPAEPAVAFCQSLHEGLIAAGRRKWAEGAPRLAKSYRKQFLIGAAALGSVVSVVGALAYLIHSRTASKHASPT